jgi:hypothetical protein
MTRPAVCLLRPTQDEDARRGLERVEKIMKGADPDEGSDEDEETEADRGFIDDSEPITSFGPMPTL